MIFVFFWRTNSKHIHADYRNHKDICIIALCQTVIYLYRLEEEDKDPVLTILKWKDFLQDYG